MDICTLIGVQVRVRQCKYLPSATKLRRLCFYTCLSTGGSASVHAGIPPPQEQAHPLKADPPPADGYCCRRYASYWNAFLFNKPLHVPLPSLCPPRSSSKFEHSVQGSHSTWRTWKNESTPGKPGNIMEF